MAVGAECWDDAPGGVPGTRRVQPELSGSGYSKAFSRSHFLYINEDILFVQVGNTMVRRYIGCSPSASPHLHENGEPRGFSCRVSFSHS